MENQIIQLAQDMPAMSSENDLGLHRRLNFTENYFSSYS